MCTHAIVLRVRLGLTFGLALLCSHYQMGLAFANNDNHTDAVPCFTNALVTLENTRHYDVKVFSNYLHERAKSWQMLNEFEKVRTPRCRVSPLPPVVRIDWCVTRVCCVGVVGEHRLSATSRAW